MSLRERTRERTRERAKEKERYIDNELYFFLITFYVMRHAQCPIAGDLL